MNKQEQSEYGIRSLHCYLLPVWSFTHLLLGSPITTDQCCGQDVRAMPDATYSRH